MQVQFTTSHQTRDEMLRGDVPIPTPSILDPSVVPPNGFLQEFEHPPDTTSIQKAALPRQQPRCIPDLQSCQFLSTAMTTDLAINRKSERVLGTRLLRYHRKATMAPSHVEQEGMASNKTRLSIFCLPTEILQDIFIRCVWNCYYWHHGCMPMAVPCWVNVSYVCRHWRNAALACPILWSYLFFRSQRWTAELLVRSEQASLEIRTKTDFTDNPKLVIPTVEKVLDHIERIEVLSMEIISSELVRQVLSKLSSPAPRLQNLFLAVKDDRSLDWPSSLFQGETPALRKLHLEQCPVLLDSLKLNALTNLSLCAIPSRFLPTIEEFLSTLDLLRALEHLSLKKALASATGFLSSAAFKAFKKIALPRLFSLKICAPLSTVIAFLSCVDVPVDAKVFLECISPNNPSVNDHASWLNSLLAQRYNISGPLSRIRSMVIKVLTGRVFLTFGTPCELNNLNSLTDFEGNLWEPRFILQLELCLQGISEDRIISDLCCALPLSHVQDLCVFNPPFPSAFWRQMLGKLQGIQSLRLSNGNMPEFSVLSLPDLTTHDGVQNQGDTVGHAQNSVLAPRLEELNIVWVTFSPTEDDHSLSNLAITRQRLVDALSKRQGFPGRLTMSQCRIGDYTVDLVMQWGDGNVQVVSECTKYSRPYQASWDEYEGEESEEDESESESDSDEDESEEDEDGDESESENEEDEDESEEDGDGDESESENEEDEDESEWGEGDEVDGDEREEGGEEGRVDVDESNEEGEEDRVDVGELDEDAEDAEGDRDEVSELGGDDEVVESDVEEDEEGGEEEGWDSGPDLEQESDGEDGDAEADWSDSVDDDGDFEYSDYDDD